MAHDVEYEWKENQSRYPTCTLPVTIRVVVSNDNLSDVEGSPHIPLSLTLIALLRFFEESYCLLAEPRGGCNVTDFEFPFASGVLNPLS